jgi:hypothetical protein
MFAAGSFYLDATGWRSRKLSNNSLRPSLCVYLKFSTLNHVAGPAIVYVPNVCLAIMPSQLRWQTAPEEICVSLFKCGPRPAVAVHV